MAARASFAQRFQMEPLRLESMHFTAARLWKGLRCRKVFRRLEAMHFTAARLWKGFRCRKTFRRLEAMHFTAALLWKKPRYRKACRSSAAMRFITAPSSPEPRGSLTGLPKCRSTCFIIAAALRSSPRFRPGLRRLAHTRSPAAMGLQANW